MDNISLIPKSSGDGKKGLPSFISFQGPRFEFTQLSKLGLGIVAILLLVSAGLFIWQKKLDNQLNSYDSELQGLISQRDLSLEERLKGLNMVLNVFKGVLDKHIYWTQIFKILEEKTLNTITFKNFGGDVSDNSINLSGKAQSYAALAKQVKIFEDTPGVKSVLSSGIGLSEDGKVDFSLDITFDGELLKKK